jgi:hypothetical protein
MDFNLVPNKRKKLDNNIRTSQIENSMVKWAQEVISNDELVQAQGYHGQMLRAYQFRNVTIDPMERQVMLDVHHRKYHQHNRLIDPAMEMLRKLRPDNAFIDAYRDKVDIGQRVADRTVEKLIQYENRQTDMDIFELMEEWNKPSPHGAATTYPGPM